MASKAVDRAHECPSLLRVFVRRGGHSNVGQYSGLEGTPVTAGESDAVEIAAYVWSDSSLVELAELVRERVEGARTRRRGGGDRGGGRGPGNRDRGDRGGDRDHRGGGGGGEKPSLGFSIVYPDRDGRYVMRPLGCVRGGARDRPNGRGGGGDGRLDTNAEERMTLADAGYDQGDYMDVAILDHEAVVR